MGLSVDKATSLRGCSGVRAPLMIEASMSLMLSRGGRRGRRVWRPQAQARVSSESGTRVRLFPH
eukprot:scaffold217233_cov38-Prasinocladus_malaysianus.AAC.1